MSVLLSHPMAGATVASGTHPLPPRRMVAGLRLQMLKISLWIRVIHIAVRISSPATTWRVLRGLLAMLRQVRSGHRTSKCVPSGAGTHRWDLYAPRYPSLAFDRFVEGELNRIVPLTARGTLQTVYLAITKKCGLRCEHCFEWNALNGAESLSSADLMAMGAKFSAAGATQIFLTGGEPLHRLADIERLAGARINHLDCWIITSGVGLSAEVARRLAASGMAGIVLSLDHWEPASHDAFRGRRGTFAGVEDAARCCTEAGLLVALSLCATRQFTTRENLDRYLDLASRLGAGFIQILEPKAVGHYEGKDVALDSSQLDLLERFHDEVNYDRRFHRAPIICYPDLIKRRVGCLGSGRRFLYVDTDGEVHPCPFCRNRAGNAVYDDAATIIDTLQTRGCPRSCGSASQ